MSTHSVRKQHPLDLPEVLLQVVLYLDAKDVVPCSLVSRAFHSFFAPYVWRNIMLGPCSAGVCQNKSFAGSILFNKPVPNSQDQSGPYQEGEFMQALQRITPWVRSLLVHDCQNPRQLTFLDHCTMIDSISFRHPINGAFGWKSWRCYESLVKRNSPHLRSLELRAWSGSSQHKLSSWCPVVECSKYGNLRSLSITHGSIYKKHMQSFWQVCLNLEDLELASIFVSFPPYTGARSNSDDEKNRSSLGSSLTNKKPLPPFGSEEYRLAVFTPTFRFPKLRKLELYGLFHVKPLEQLHWFISLCPMLSTLGWGGLGVGPSPLKEFTRYFAAMTWPELDSITIKSESWVSNKEYAAILQAARRPLKVLNLNLSYLGTDSFTLLRQNHFKTLAKVNLLHAESSPSDPSGSSEVSVSGHFASPDTLEGGPHGLIVTGPVPMKRDHAP
ncbi:hypothetical protein BGX34_003932 [Mortierella sp. NVP85]|nr:hypothetical protein BGX34_003932 [Mortierella sp. NVP85]